MNKLFALTNSWPLRLARNFTIKLYVFRTRNIFKQLKLPDYTDTYVKVCTYRICYHGYTCVKALGSESSYGPHSREGVSASREVVLWFAVSHSNKKALEIFSREIAPAGTGMGD